MLDKCQSPFSKKLLSFETMTDYGKLVCLLKMLSLMLDNFGGKAKLARRLRLFSLLHRLTGKTIEIK
jgi:hypothetical protein